MKCVYRGLLAFLALTSCAGRKNQDSEVSIFHPSLIEVQIINQKGEPVANTLTTDDVPATLRAVATGFTPVKKVVLLSLSDKRNYELASVSDKVYEIDLSQPFMNFLSSPDGKSHIFRFKVVATDTEDDDTSSKEIALTLNTSDNIAH